MAEQPKRFAADMLPGMLEITKEHSNLGLVARQLTALISDFRELAKYTEELQERLAAIENKDHA